jgi:hypothetical protein
VIERRAGPVRRAVADIARRRKTHRCVLRIICIVVVRLVARDASRVRWSGCNVICGNWHATVVCAGQRKSRWWSDRRSRCPSWWWCGTGRRSGKPADVI